MLIKLFLNNLLYYIIYWFTWIMTKLGRYRIIKDRINKEDYLERYYLFLKDRNTFPFNIFLHKFLKSDPDDLHDHPWNYRTLILAGGYWEYSRDGTKRWCGPFTFRTSLATSYHRIELDEKVPYCWTLFIPGKKVREWGFLTDQGWVHNLEYLNKQKQY